MSIFKLKGETITYFFSTSTTQPSSDFSGRIGFSTASSSMVTGSLYNMYISTENNREGDVYTIIDQLDGVESNRDIPVKGVK